MIAILVPLLLAAGDDAWTPDRCDPFDFEVARGAREIFLKPTDDQIDLVVERLRSSALAPLERDPKFRSGDAWFGVCFGSVRDSIEKFEGKSRRARQARVEQAQASCTEPSTRPTDALRPLEFVPCDEISFLTLVAIGDPIALEALPRFPKTVHWDDARFWLTLFREHPDPQERLRLALERGGRVAGWAIEEIAGDADPRRWDPKLLAVLVRVARAEDAKPTLHIRSGLPPADSPLDRLNRLIKALVPMGAIRAFELIEPRSIRVTGINAPFRPPGPAGAYRPPYLHFEDEDLLHSHEWGEANPEFPLPLHSTLSGEKKWKAVLEMRRYGDIRWYETDWAAPHPDLDAIRSELERLERTETSP